MNKFTYTDFYNQWLNKSSSLGGNYNQCVTLFKEFLNKAGYPNPGRAIGGSGGAREIWYRRNALGYGDYFEFTQIGRPGDWFIWDSVYGWWQGVYYGHVAMLIKDNGNGTGQFLGMNQSYSQAPAQVMTLTYNGSCGVLRYKGYGTQASTQSVTTYNANNLIAEHAIATLTVDSVAIRQGSPSGNVLSRQNKGYQFEYYYKTVANGHRWVINKDKTQFMAISGSEQQGKDLWANFSAIQAPEEPTKPSGTISLTQEDGIATFTVDGVRARYDSPTGTVCKTYNTGDSMRYYWKYVGNGHRYVVGKEEDRKVFVAVSATEDRSQMWATFDVPKEDKKEEVKPIEKPSEQPKPVEKPNLTQNVKGYGVDISEHNGANFDVSQYDFVIIRAAWGENTDKLFETYVQKCVDAKIPYGVYVYDYALDDSQAKAEAEYVLNLIKDKDVQLGVWFDMEDADHYKAKKGVLTKERCTSSCRVFCDILKEHGYYTGVYTSTSWIGTYVDTEYPLWIANWGSNNGTIQSDQSGVAVMHQYCANTIDKDVIFHEFDFFKSNPIKEEVKPTPQPEEPKPEVKPEESKPELKPDDKKDEKEEIDNKKVNSLIDLLIKLVKKILKVFS